MPWEGLLQRAFELDGETANGVFGVLHGVRCCGARLERPGTGPGGWRIVPGTSYLGGRRAWEQDRTQWLLPWRATIARLVLRLSEPRVSRDAVGERSASECAEAPREGFATGRYGAEARSRVHTGAK
jgi:hypothetical protein